MDKNGDKRVNISCLIILNKILGEESNEMVGDDDNG